MSVDYTWLLCALLQPFYSWLPVVLGLCHRDSTECVIGARCQKRPMSQVCNPNLGHGAGPCTRDLISTLIDEDTTLGVLQQTHCWDSFTQPNPWPKHPFQVTAMSVQALAATCCPLCPRNRCLCDPLHTISTAQGASCLFFLYSILASLWTVCLWDVPGADVSLERCTQVTPAIVNLLCTTDLLSHIKAFSQQFLRVVNEQSFCMGLLVQHRALWVLDSI